jgi:hypothetical protein
MYPMGKGEVLVPLAFFFLTWSLWLWGGFGEEASKRLGNAAIYICTRWTAGCAGLILSVRFFIYIAHLFRTSWLGLAVPVSPSSYIFLLLCQIPRIYTPSVLKYKMFSVCEANVSRHVLVCVFE